MEPHKYQLIFGDIAKIIQQRKEGLINKYFSNIWYNGHLHDKRIN